MDEKEDSQDCEVKFKNEKIKSRNLSEKKRRDQFNVLINELYTMVSSTCRKMDKSSVLKSAISFLRTHTESSILHSIEDAPNWKPSFLPSEEFTHLILESLDAFIIVFLSTGKILHTSESVTSLLGYSPSGRYSSVFDMIHESDCATLNNLISNLSSENFEFSIFVHMKREPMQETLCFELVQLQGMSFHCPSTSTLEQSCANSEGDSSLCSPVSSSPKEWPTCLVAVARLQTPLLLRSVSFARDNEFTSRHSLEWTFLYLDHRALPIIGYLPFEVLGTSGYDYYHIEDLDNIASGHKMLLKTGEGTSGFYRFLTKGQQWIWLQTQSFISYHQWNSKPEFVVCTNVVVSVDSVRENCGKETKKTSFKSGMSCNSTANNHTSHNADSLSSPSVDIFDGHTVQVPDEYHTNSEFMPSTPSQVTCKSQKYPYRIKSKYSSRLTNKSDDVHQEGLTLVSSTSPYLHSQQENQSPRNRRSDVHYRIPRCHQFATPLHAVPQTLWDSSTDLRVHHPEVPSLSHFLLRRRQFLEKQIQLKQEELQQVSEQLSLVQQLSPPGIYSNHV